VSRHDLEKESRSLERSLGKVLLAGVLVSASVVVLGGFVYLFRHGLEIPDYRTFHAESTSLRALGGILSDAGRLSGRGIIQLGLVLLIATPIARVLVASWAFSRERDWLYVGIGLTVFSLLLFGIVTG
jgi:uncharacterized membrane protein